MSVANLSKTVSVITFLTLAVSLHAQSPFNHGDLKVDASGRYLEHMDGTPFLYLGDTAWELLVRLDFKETCDYLDNRSKKGFSVIQTVIIPELENIGDNTASGSPVFKKGKKIRLNPHYLKHIDSVLTYAEKKGLYLALLPTWGDKVDKKWGLGPEIFNVKNAREYGILLGKRWATRKNIIWIIGGDRGGDEQNKDIWNALAQGIKFVDRHHLMTFHPNGEHSSAMWFHNEDWLDFNMIQTGHCQQTYDIYRRLMWPDMQLNPVKPVMDGEPRYEDIPRNFKYEDGRFKAIDVRHTLYQSMLTGACGYTYGNNNIWQMYSSGRKPQCDACRYWYDAMDMEGACQLIHFVNLWQEFPFREGRMLNNCLRTIDDYCEDEALALYADKWMICYFPGGSRWKLLLPSNWNGSYSFTWMDPRSGRRITAGTFCQRCIELTLPPKEGCSEKDNDWVLLIEKQ